MPTGNFMFKRKPKPETPEDEQIPDSIEPWEMLGADETVTAALQERFPHFAAVARRLDEDTVACFDKGADGTGKTIVVLEHVSTMEKTTQRTLSGFGAWFDEAVAAHKKHAQK